MDEFIIEVGKFYKSRDGHKIRIYAIDGYPNYPIHGAILGDDGWGVEQWTQEGFYLWRESECRADIISEWEE